MLCYVIIWSLSDDICSDFKRILPSLCSSRAVLKSGTVPSRSPGPLIHTYIYIYTHTFDASDFLDCVYTYVYTYMYVYMYSFFPIVCIYAFICLLRGDKLQPNQIAKWLLDLSQHALATGSMLGGLGRI